MKLTVIWPLALAVAVTVWATALFIAAGRGEDVEVGEHRGAVDTDVELPLPGRRRSPVRQSPAAACNYCPASSPGSV